MIFQKFGQRVLDILSSPLKIVLICAAFGSFSVILNGSVYQLWTLHQQSSQMLTQIMKLESEQILVAKKIKQASHRDFIERQAREQLNLVNDDDLVFVFAEN